MDLPALVLDRDNNGVARDVVYAVLVAARALGQVERFAPRDLHGFVRERVKYVADDDPDEQRVRMPWRTIADGATDCKSSAIFIGSMILASGRPVVVRFIDGEGCGAWTHVYILAPDGAALDPLLPFNVHPNKTAFCDVAIS